MARPFHKNVLAKALYDNIAEAPDELAFHKGDVITVIEQNTGGLEGWWLCSLNGRQGIAPGNRLKLLAGMYDSPSPSRALLVESGGTKQMVSPQKMGQSYVYDTLPLRKGLSGNAPQQETYDVPPSRTAPTPQHPAAHLGYQTVPGPRKHVSLEIYDRPPNSLFPKQPSPEKVQSPGYVQMEGYVRKEPAQEIYDIPPSYHQSPQQELYDVPPNKHVDNKTMHSPVEEVYDTPPRKGFESSEKNSPVRGSIEKGNIYLPRRTLPLAEEDSDIYEEPTFKGEMEVYDIPPCHRDVMMNQQLSVKGVAPIDIYDIPPSQKMTTSSAPTSPSDLYAKPIKHVGNGPKEIYDIPPNKMTQQRQDYTYDVPPQVSRDKPLSEGKGQKGGVSVTELEGKVSVMSLSKSSKSNASDILENFPSAMLNIEREEAAELIVKKQQALDSAGAYLLSYVSSSWRMHNNLEPRINEVRAACNQLKLVTKEFLEFAEGTVVNALQVHDATLYSLLSKLLKSLIDAYAAMQKAIAAMDDAKWNADKLCSRLEKEEDPAYLDSFVLEARTVLDCNKRFCVAVQDNICVLFKKTAAMQERPLPTPPGQTGPLRSSTWVAAEKEGAVGKDTVQVRPLPTPPPISPTTNMYEELPSDNGRISPEKVADYGYLTKAENLANVQIIPTEQEVVSLTNADKQILNFYANEVQTLSNSITNAVELFFSSVEGSQPPKVFVAHSKHVIILGHKLVFLGDTLHSNIENDAVKQRIIQTSDILCECLSVAVNATKTAALQYPAVSVLQEMVDRITEVHNATQDLSNAITHSAGR